MNSRKKIKILLVHGHIIVRQGLCELFTNQSDVEVVGEVDVGENVVQATDMLKPDVIVIDINMPKINVTALTCQIIDRNPRIRFVALITNPHIHIIEHAIKAGFSGFISLNCGFNELVDAVRMVNKNGRYSCPQIRDILAKSYINRMHSDSEPESLSLTDREYEIIRFLSMGMTSRKIATKMKVSFKTIDAGRRQIMRKLNIDSMAGLIKHAIRTGITSI